MSRQGYNHGAAARAGTGFETSYYPERNLRSASTMSARCTPAFRAGVARLV